jgi:hypothetical protein
LGRSLETQFRFFTAGIEANANAFAAVAIVASIVGIDAFGLAVFIDDDDDPCRGSYCGDAILTQRWTLALCWCSVFSSRMIMRWLLLLLIQCDCCLGCCWCCDEVG